MNRQIKIELPLPVDSKTNRITCDGLDILMNKIKSVVRDTPEIKSIQSKAYKDIKPFLVDGLVIAIKCTSILINRGVDDGGIEADSYNLLSGNFNQLAKKNPILQNALRDARIKYKKEDTNDFQVKADFNDGKGEVTINYGSLHPKDIGGVADIPLSPSDTSKVLDDLEGKEEVTEDQKIADVTTHDGGRIRFDKEQLTVVFYKRDGSVAARIKLAPKETWRRVVVDFFVAFAKGVWNTIRHPIKTGRKIKENFKSWFAKKEVENKPAPKPKEKVIEKTTEKEVTKVEKTEDDSNVVATA